MSDNNPAESAMGPDFVLGLANIEEVRTLRKSGCRIVCNFTYRLHRISPFQSQEHHEFADKPPDVKDSFNFLISFPIPQPGPYVFLRRKNNLLDPTVVSASKAIRIPRRGRAYDRPNGSCRCFR